MRNAFQLGAKAATAFAAVAAFSLGLPAAASAQDPNPGALTLTGGVDVPSVYVFRGLVQERDPKLTLFPYADLGIALISGDGGSATLSVNIGTWHSLQTGSSGSDGPSQKIHYEEDFYATLSLGLGSGLTLGATYTAYTSPNFMFNNVKEMSVKLARTGTFNPYGLVAFELDDKGQADTGTAKGTYVELGVAPSWPLSKASLTIPVKLGLSAKDYYELAGQDHTFGYLDVGALISVPIGGAPGKFGSWNIHAGVDLYRFGDTTRATNGPDQKKTRVVAMGGLGFTY